MTLGLPHVMPGREHAWHIGVRLPAPVGFAQLATCKSCGILRVQEGAEERFISSGGPALYRVTGQQPPCADAKTRAAWIDAAAAATVSVEEAADRG